ncbi:hypothetical protein CCHR01_07105 [Colletotrichum chrysophilum]|uniref:Uncharacterized protein n=1 Tax=Colletotrichum chrysophilum TaxID=1836956 RepID=A0AAD9ALF4_9PEZI|nr:hypothetical protein CCHR01_07105 [Colletotrichum chrysophilum]
MAFEEHLRWPRYVTLVILACLIRNLNALSSFTRRRHCHCMLQPVVLSQVSLEAAQPQTCLLHINSKHETTAPTSAN